MDDIEQLKELLNFTSYLSDKDIFDAASLFVYLQSLKLGYDYSIIDKIVIAEGKNYQDPWGNRYLQDWILTREHNREGLLQFIEQTSPEELNATDKEQQTALHRVLQYLDAITEQDNERRHSELVCIIKNLIKHGADIEIENETGSKFTDSTFYQDNEDQVKKWQNTFVASQKTRKRLTLQRDKKRPSSMQSSQVAQQTKKFFTPINCMFMGLAAVAFFYAGCQLFGKKNIKATIKIKQVSV